MKKFNKLGVLGELLLLFATIAWGTSFIVLKQTIETVPTFYVLALRFIVSSIMLGAVFFKRFKTITKGTLIRGAVLGAILSMAYIVQTIGLKYTSPARNAFITASYCVMTPFFMWFLTKIPPKPYNIIAAIICFTGVGFIAFSNGEQTGSNVLLGDMLTIVCAVFYALQIIYINRSQNKFKDDNVQLLIVELFVAGLIPLILSLIFELPNGISVYALNSEQLIKIVYLTIVCTLFAQIALIFGQKFTPVNKAAIILCLEAVFGTFFSVVFGYEKLTVTLIIGFSIVFIGMVMNELELDPTKLFNKKHNIEE